MTQALGAASLILALVYFWFPDMVIGRGVFLIAAPLVSRLLAGWRMLFDWLGSRMAPRERLLLVGTGSAALALATELFERRHELGVSLVGFVDPIRRWSVSRCSNPGVIGTVDDIPTIVRTHNVDRVVVSLSDARGKLPMDKLLEMKLDRGVAFDHLASVYEEYTGKIALENLRPSWLIFSEGFKKTRAMLAVKRVARHPRVGRRVDSGRARDAAGGRVGQTDIAGPVLYHQSRVGQHGRLFTVHKLRSMRADAEAKTGAVWASSNEYARDEVRTMVASHAFR